ncbi:MAG: FecR family protein [Verrucomicrobiota bacterium]
MRGLYPLCLIFILLVVLASSSWAQGQALIVSVSGQVEKETEDGEFLGVASGARISVGTRFRTGTNGEITIALLNGLAVTLKSDSQAQVLQLNTEVDSRGKQTAMMGIEEGRMVVLIAEEKKAEIEFSIKTPKGIAKPRGTFYALQVLDGEAFLAVKEGKVGLDQFTPLEYEDPAREVATGLEEIERNYGRTTTTSPRG